MEKKTIYKIGAILVILALLVPVIATATEPTLTNLGQESTKSLKQKPTLTASDADVVMSETAMRKKVGEAQTMEFGEYNMVGRWGLYDTLLDDTFIAQKDGNDIFGRVSRNNGKYTYFFITIRPILKTFMGIVFEGDEFHSITGKFINKDGKFNAMWEMNNDLEGWFVGKLI